MSRRASDKTQGRLVLLLLALNATLSIFAAAIGYKAISALDDFGALMDAAAHIREKKSLLPEGY